MSVTVADDLAFGSVTIPSEGTCRYTVAPDGTGSVAGPAECLLSDGFVSPARFRIACLPTALVQVDVALASLAATGTAFAAPGDPLMLDGGAAGPATQVHACDSDGITDAAVGGVLAVGSDAPEELAARIGTVRVEVIYQ